MKTDQKTRTQFVLQRLYVVRPVMDPTARWVDFQQAVDSLNTAEQMRAHAEEALRNDSNAQRFTKGYRIVCRITSTTEYVVDVNRLDVSNAAVWPRRLSLETQS
jgi:hypothetical protein